MDDATGSDIKKRRKGRPGVADPGIASVAVMLRLAPEDVADIDRAMADNTRRSGWVYGSRQEWLRDEIGNILAPYRGRWARADERAAKAAKKRR